MAGSDTLVVRVATFNAQHGARPGRLPSTHGLVETCRGLDADVLGLQEVDRHVPRTWFADQPAAVARVLGYQHRSAPAKRTPIGGRQCNALCARGSIADVEVVELPGRPQDERRVLLLARVVLPAGAVTVGVTHLATAGRARVQLPVVLERLDARPPPHLLLGDLNLTEGDVEPVLAAHGLQAAPSGPTFPASSPRRRIDWIAVGGGLSVGPARVHRTLVGDHCPLVADVAFGS
ncbi:MAG: endonuclease/exonuclease/phosphatase [Acidimicrobiia bacterium]|nr:MAG: endonuclease/exonuclease/phosphatase [Acidimicrobiia bacterium]